MHNKRDWIIRILWTIAIVTIMGTPGAADSEDNLDAIMDLQSTLDDIERSVDSIEDDVHRIKNSVSSIEHTVNSIERHGVDCN